MLKPATLQDLELIQTLADESWRDAYTDILQPEQIDYMMNLMYSKEVLSDHLQNDKFPYYIIQHDEVAVGFVGFEIDAEFETTKLHRLYLLPSAKGKGLGKEAIQYVQKQALNNDNSRVILTVNKNNSAKMMYEKLNFKVYDEAVFDIGNGYVMDDYLMEWRP